MKKTVAILLGSDSDWDEVKEAASILERFGIGYEARVISAHRSPELLRSFIRKADRNGVQVYIAAAGGAAHLPGVVAAQTSRPVIGIPISTKQFKGIDSYLSILQMPGGIPVATMSVGKAGAKNAGILAAQILALKDGRLARSMKEHKSALIREVKEKDKKLQAMVK